MKLEDYMLTLSNITHEFRAHSEITDVIKRSEAAETETSREDIEWAIGVLHQSIKKHRGILGVKAVQDGNPARKEHQKQMTISEATLRNHVVEVRNELKAKAREVESKRPQKAEEIQKIIRELVERLNLTDLESFNEETGDDRVKMVNRRHKKEFSAPTPTPTHKPTTTRQPAPAPESTKKPRKETPEELMARLRMEGKIQ
jgi:DNA repair ATPase RecN